MADFLYLFHNDVDDPQNEGDPAAWGRFIEVLRQGGHFIGGSSLDEGCSRKGKLVGNEITARIAGYILIRAENLEQATALLDICPVILRGGSVEVRPLVRD